MHRSRHDSVLEGARTLLLLALAGCVHPTPPPARPPAEEAAISGEIVLGTDTRLRPLAEGAWLVTTFRSPEEPANALLVAGADRSVLVDTGWSPRQAQQVLAWARDVLGRPIGAAMITGPDPDRAGGASALTDVGVPVFASVRAAALLAERGAPIASTPIEPESIPELHWMFVRIDPDPEAIVAYQRPTRIVFGGSFVDALDAETPGRVGDQDRSGWRAALDLVAASYPDAAIVVPGRGEPGTLELVAHTRALIADCHADAECTVLSEQLESCACCGCTEPRAMLTAAIERERSMQPSCAPICDGVPCPPCPTPDELARLRAVCVRGECALAPAP